MALVEQNMSCQGSRHRRANRHRQTVKRDPNPKTLTPRPIHLPRCVRCGVESAALPLPLAYIPWPRRPLLAPNALRHSCTQPQQWQTLTRSRGVFAGMETLLQGQGRHSLGPAGPVCTAGGPTSSANCKHSTLSPCLSPCLTASSG